MKTLLPVLLTLILAAASFAADVSKIELKPNDDLDAVLLTLKGQRVELHLKNGEKVSGKLDTMSNKVLHISALTGQEFYDAAIATDQVVSVVVRTK